MAPSTSHWYIGFVSLNKISGKLKFFVSRDRAHVRDRSASQRLGFRGITMHTLWTPRLDQVIALVQAWERSKRRSSPSVASSYEALAV